MGAISAVVILIVGLVLSYFSSSLKPGDWVNKINYVNPYCYIKSCSDTAITDGWCNFKTYAIVVILSIITAIIPF
jgi:ABC-type multidrug transport system permease subunit